MSYSKELITELGLPKVDLKNIGKAIEKNIQEPMIQQVQPTAPKTQPGVITALGQKIDVNPVLSAVPPVAAKSTQAAIDTAFSTPNLIKAGAAALAGGALIGGGLALGRRIGNIGSKKDKKKLNEKSKKDDLYYRQVDFDPYAPRYTVPQLATTAGGITGTTAGSIYGSKVGTALGGPVGGLLGAGIGGALGGAAGSIGAYQLAKMARPKKKKKLVQYYR